VRAHAREGCLMPDRVAQLLLETCAEAGVLKTFVLFYELMALANGKEFTTMEVCAHAKGPANGRLRDAIVKACGEIDARKLGKVLSQWRGSDVGFGYTVSSIGTEQGWILWKFVACDPIREPAQSPDDALMVESLNH
jgi:hypothetical protein